MDVVKQAVVQIIVVLFLIVGVIYYFTSRFAAVTFAIFPVAVYVAWCFRQVRLVVPFDLVKQKRNFVPLEEVLQWNPRRQIGNSPVVLVLLHCVLSSLLRGDLFDNEELLDIKLRSRMTGITHFAFSDREGLYECHQNRVGFDKLLNAVSLL